MDKMKNIGFYRVYGYDGLGKCNQDFIIAKNREQAMEKTWWIPDTNKQAYYLAKPSQIALIKAKALEQYYRFFTRYIRPSESETTFDDWRYKESFKDFDTNLDFIISLMKSGHKVRCGYMATSIKGFHTNLIFYKKR